MMTIDKTTLEKREIKLKRDWTGAHVKFFKTHRTYGNELIPKGTKGIVRNYYRGLAIQTEAPRKDSSDMTVFITRIDPCCVEYLGHSKAKEVSE